MTNNTFCTLLLHSLCAVDMNHSLERRDSRECRDRKDNKDDMVTTDCSSF